MIRRLADTIIPIVGHPISIARGPALISSNSIKCTSDELPFSELSPQSSWTGFSGQLPWAHTHPQPSQFSRCAHLWAWPVGQSGPEPGKPVHINLLVSTPRLRRHRPAEGTATSMVYINVSGGCTATILTRWRAMP